MKKYWWLSLGYWFSSRSLGLLIHPYMTMRILMRERFLRPLTLLPTVLGGWWWVLGMIVVRIQIFFWSSPTLGLFVWVWGVWFLVIWQLVLLYLWGRFRDL